MNSPILTSDAYGQFDTNFDVNQNAEIVNAVIISLFTDRRVNTDEIPAGQTDRRGWWGDENNELIGSKLWLLDREKRMEEILPRAEAYAKEALAWMVTDRIAKKVLVAAELDGASKFFIKVELQKPSGEELNFKFKDVWNWINGN